uniref:Uncharacterized protein n=1 Tax=Cacopsylla melanoneura TaxID=428564 RepID=A0A8D8XH31_9HEMI
MSTTVSVVTFLLVVIVQVSVCSEPKDLCSRPNCACIKDTSVNCTFDFHQDIVLSEKSLSFQDYKEVEFSNINELNILPGTFNKNNGAGVKKIQFRNIAKLNIVTQYYSGLVYFDNVTIPDIFNNSFQSGHNELRIVFVNSHIGQIRQNAFSATLIPSIQFTNTSIQRVERWAFSGRAQIENFSLNRVKLKTLESNAIVSAISNLSIQHSNISDINSEGIFINAAPSVQLSNNIINSVQSNGISFNNWNYVVMENNSFKTLYSTAISISGSNRLYTFKFIGNALGEVESNALNFDFENLINKSNTNIVIDENFFVVTCDCSLFDFVKNSVSSDVVSLFYKTSYCNINTRLSQCFNKPEGLLNIKNFNDTMCVQNLKCHSNANIETTKTRMYPGLTSTFDWVFDGNEDDDTLVKYVCASLVILALVILLCITCLCMKQSRLLSKVKSNFFTNIYSKLFIRNSSDKCTTKNKMFTNDYSELTKHIKLDMSEIALDSQVHYDSFVNKATQTLPEELTPELLQNLRVKLEDPNEYCLARDMIEHLYDLIKIEESCNKNIYSGEVNNHYMSNVIGDKPDDNIYDEIEIRPSRADTSTSGSKYQKSFDDNRSGINVLSTFQNKSDKTLLSHTRIRNNKKFIDVGTRVPSPDKLLPYDFPNIRSVTLLDEYQMPRDNRSSYIYSELTYSTHPPDTSQPRDQLRLLDDAINIYMDASLRGSKQNDLNYNRPLPSRPEPSDTNR